MEKLSFEFEIKGVTKSINSIAEAKEALIDLQDVVENSTFGSEEFKSASQEIENVQAKLIEATSKGVEPAASGFKKLKDELKLAKNAQAEAAQAFGEGSKEYKAAAQQVANLQDKIDDLKDSSVSLKGTGIERLNSGVGLLKEGFANFDTDKLKIGFNALGSAMKAIPIFLIIEGLRLLYENFDKVAAFAKKFFDLQSDAEKDIAKLNKQIKEQEEYTKALVGTLQREIELMEAQGKSTDMILKKKKELALVQLKELELQGQLSVAKIKEIAENDSLAESAQRLLVSALRSQGNAIAADVLEGQILASKKERMAEEIKAANETNEKIKNIANSLRVEEAKIETKKTEDRKKKNDELKKPLQEAIEEENKLKRETKDKEILLEVEKQAEKEVVLTDSLERQNVINEYYRQLDKKALVKWNEEQKQLLIKRTNDGLNTLTQFTNASSALSDAVYGIQLENAKKGSAEELKIKRQQFETNKKIQIGAAIISGVQGTLNAITAKSTIPQPFDTVYKGLQVAAIVGTTAATINKISSTPFDGGGNAGASTSIPAVGGSAPAFNSIAPTVNPSTQQPLTTRLDANGNPINQNGSFRIKADVVENEMTEKQKEQERRKANITF